MRGAFRLMSGWRAFSVAAALYMSVTERLLATRPLELSCLRVGWERLMVSFGLRLRRFTGMLDTDCVPAYGSAVWIEWPSSKGK